MQSSPIAVPKHFDTGDNYHTAFIHYIQCTSVQCYHFSLAGESLSGDNPTLPEIQKFLSSIQEPVVFDKVFTEIVQ